MENVEGSAKKWAALRPPLAALPLTAAAYPLRVLGGPFPPGTSMLSMAHSPGPTPLPKDYTPASFRIATRVPLSSAPRISTLADMYSQIISTTTVPMDP